MTRAPAELLWSQAGRDVEVLFCSAPGFAGRHYVGASIAVTGEPVPDLNMALVWTDVNASDAIAEYASLLSARGASGLLLLRDGEHASLSTCAEAAGFVRAVTLPLMVRDARDLSPRALDCVLEPVENPEQLSSVNTLISHAFEVPLESAQRAFGAALLKDTSFTAFRLVRHGAPVCSLHSTRYRTSVGLWSLGTPAELRRQGLGRDAMVAAMEWHVNRGAESFYLISTPAGQHLYEQLGFAISEQVSVWVPSP